MVGFRIGSYFAPSCQVAKTLASLSASKCSSAPEIESQRQRRRKLTRENTGFADAWPEPTPSCHGQSRSPLLVVQSLSASGNEAMSGRLSPLAPCVAQVHARVVQRTRTQTWLLRGDLIFRHCPQMFGLPSNQVRIGSPPGGLSPFSLHQPCGRSEHAGRTGRRAELVPFTRLPHGGGPSSRSCAAAQKSAARNKFRATAAKAVGANAKKQGLSQPASNPCCAARLRPLSFAPT